MTAVFVDTAFFIALLCQDDQHHVKAKEAAKLVQSPMVTTYWVLVELGNFLGRRPQRDQLLPFISALRANQNLLILPADSEYFELGLELYANRPDKDWSLTDCISFEVMKRRGLNSSLTSDHHFVQAGFDALML